MFCKRNYNPIYYPKGLIWLYRHVKNYPAEVLTGFFGAFKKCNSQGFRMIDWFRGEIPFLHIPLPSGKVLSIDSDGSMEWEAVKAVRVRGSYESSIKVSSTGGNGSGLATSLLIDGNLAKFLQGHNIVGSRDLNFLVLEAFKKIFSVYSEYLGSCFSSKITETQIEKGDYLVKMIDINALYDLGNDPSVESWLYGCEMVARTRSGRAERSRGTVYIQKNSRRWAVKFYNKLKEVESSKKRQLPEVFQNSGLKEFVTGKLRCELRFMSLELKRLGITHGRHLSENRIDKLFNEYIGRIDMKAQATLINEKVLELPRPIQSTYQLWKQGCCLRNLLPKTTFYKHRALLLKHDIDINVPPRAKTDNVIPLIRVLEAKPVKIPDWIYDERLIACR